MSEWMDGWVDGGEVMKVVQTAPAWLMRRRLLLSSGNTFLITSCHISSKPSGTWTREDLISGFSRFQLRGSAAPVGGT